MKKQYVAPVVEVMVISLESICQTSQVPVVPDVEPMG